MPAKGPRSRSLRGKPTQAKSSDGGPTTTVKDCLHWPTSSVMAAKKMNGRRSKSLKGKGAQGGIGRQNGGGRDSPKRAEGEEKEVANLATSLENYYLDDPNDDPVVCSGEDGGSEAMKRNAKKKKRNNNGNRMSNQKDGDREVSLGDLLSYKYFREAQEQKKIEDDAKKQAREEAIRLSRERRNDLKLNKTAQLRSIAISTNIDGQSESSKQELWKMSKFSNAQPKISTCLTRGETTPGGADQRTNETKTSYDMENDTSRFKDPNDHLGFSPPGIHVTRGFETRTSSTSNFAYEYLPSTNISQF